MIETNVDKSSVSAMDALPLKPSRLNDALNWMRRATADDVLRTWPTVRLRDALLPALAGFEAGVAVGAILSVFSRGASSALRREELYDQLAELRERIEGVLREKTETKPS